MATRFSLISAVYNVGRYLDDFFASLDSQTFDHSRVEVVLVDDGSTDDSDARIRAWSAATAFNVVHLSKENGGQSSARNMGIESSSGEWISFPDPDDIIDREYLQRMDAALAVSESVDLGVANLINFWEEKGELANTHPLRFRFNGGTQVYDLVGYPRNIHLHASSGFFKLHTVMASNVRFDTRIRPVFEDGHFVQCYLLARKSTTVVSESRAIYKYRRRADNSSTLQTSGTNPSRYTDVLRYGHVDLLRRATGSGSAPEWLQNAILYDVFWVLRNQESLSPSTGAIPRRAAEEFFELLTEIVSHLDQDVIRAFDLIRTSNTQREVLLYAASRLKWNSGYCVVREYDNARKLLRLTYRYTGEKPIERVIFRGQDEEPLFDKTRTIKYLGLPLIYERQLWVSSRGVTSVYLDGVRVSIRYSEREIEQYFIRPAVVRKRFSPSRHLKRLVKRPPAVDIATMVMFKNPALRKKFEDAWVFMDRPVSANDNAEHLFKYVRRHRRDLNAWFVVKRDSKDWHRLRKEGVDRLIAHGSFEWRVLCLRAKVMLSSHVDVHVMKPFRLSNGRQPNWQFVFLQHGVTQNDLSKWFNSKSLALMVTATRDEYRSIVGDGSAYSMSAKEVSLTGFPRFDELDRKVIERGRVAPRTITVMPTWRKSLDILLDSSGAKEERFARFAESDFAKSWNAFFSHPDLTSLLAASDMRLRFMPHPNLEPYLDVFTVPRGTSVVGYSDVNVQDVVVDSKVLVTDYSSVVFDGAYVGRPTVYFQFDLDSMYGGGHIALPGYFDYEQHGFGPVASSPSEAVAGLESLLNSESVESREAATRMNSTFVREGGSNCARVMQAVEERLTPIDPMVYERNVLPVIAEPTRYIA